MAVLPGLDDIISQQLGKREAETGRGGLNQIIDSKLDMSNTAPRATWTEMYKARMEPERREKVENWMDQYNLITGRIRGYQNSLNGRWTEDIWGGWGDKLDELIESYKPIRSYAGNFGIEDETYQNLIKWRNQGRESSDLMGQLGEEQYNRGLWQNRYEGQSMMDILNALKGRMAPDEREWLEGYRDSRSGWGNNPSTQADAGNAAARQEKYTSNQKRIGELNESIAKYENYEAMIKRLAVTGDMSEMTGDALTWHGISQDEYKQMKREQAALEDENRAYEKGGLSEADKAIAGIDPESLNRTLPSWRGSVTDRLGAYMNAKDSDRTNATLLMSQQNAATIDGLNPFDREAAAMGTADRAMATNYLAGAEKRWDMIEERELQTYYYLLQNVNQESADRYLDSLTETLQRRGVEQLTEAERELSNGEKVLTNAASLITNLTGGIYGAMDDATRMIAGQDIQPYNTAHFAQNYTQAVRGDEQERWEAGAQKIENWWNNLFSDGEDIEKAEGGNGEKSTFVKVAGQTYQAIMSGLDSALGATLLSPIGFGKVGAYDVVMGASAFSQRAKELYDQGATKGQIALGAAGAGFLEAFFEHFSAEKFVESYLEKPPKNLGQFILKTLVQGGVEASEEAATEVGNIAWDSLTRAYHSDMEQEIRQYVDQGKSEGQAIKAALGDKAADVFWAMYGGFISGGAMGAAGGAFNATLNRYQQNSMNQETGRSMIRQGSASDIIAKAQQLGVDPKMLELAQQKAATTWEQFQKMERKEQKQTARALGAVAEQTMQQQLDTAHQNEREHFKEEATKALSVRNVQNPEIAAEVLAKQEFDGEELSRKEQKIAEEAGGEKTSREIMQSESYRQFQKENARELETTMYQAYDRNNRNNPERIAAERAAVEEMSQGYDDPQAMAAAFQDGQSAIQYEVAYENAYRIGQSGQPVSAALDSAGARYLNEGQIKAAWEAGRKAAGYVTEKGSVRQGQKWNDRADSNGTVRSVEKGTGGSRAQAGSQTEGSTEGKPAGKKVSSQDLNITGGTDNKNIRRVDRSQWKQEWIEAEAKAKERGMTLEIVEGDMIEVMDRKPGGEKTLVRCRGLVDGKRIIVRADDEQFTAEQIAAHEMGHDKIRNGEITVADVRKQLRERYTEEQINKIIDMYADAYSFLTGNMTDAQISKLRMEILEEIICDSLGEMNVFAGVEMYRNYVGTVGVFLRDANKAAQNRGAATAEKSTAENGGVVKYSIAEIIDENGKSYGDGVILDSDKLTGLSDEARVAKVVGIIRSFGGKPFTAIDSNGNEQEIIVVPNKKYKNQKGKDVYANRHLTKFLNDTVKQEALVLVDQMISTATYESSEPAQHQHGWLDNNGKNDWENWKVFLQEKDGTVWEAYMRVTNSTEGEKILYEVYPIKKVEGTAQRGTTTTKDKVAQTEGEVKRNKYRDHREIGEIYEATRGTAALNRFLNDGNIRIMAESPGIDLPSGVEPTAEQYAAIRKFVYSHGMEEGKFYIDFSGKDGHRDGSYSYDGNVRADRIINDIKYFYENGTTREDSGLSRFYSRALETTEDLRKQNSYLRQQLKKAREQMQLSEGATADKSDVRAVANKVLFDYGSSRNKAETAKRMQVLADYIVGEQEPDYREMMDIARDISSFILEGSAVDVNVDQQEMLKDIKYTLSTTRINVDESMKQETGDWKEFKQRNRGTLRFAEDGSGTSIDSLWLELQDTYGAGLFPDDIMNPGDQLMQLEEIVQSLQPEVQNPYAGVWGQTIEQMSIDMIDQLMSEEVRQAKPTRADRIADRAAREARETVMNMVQEDFGQFIDDLADVKAGKRISRMQDRQAKQLKRQRNKLIEQGRQRNKLIEQGRQREQNRIQRQQESQTRQKIQRLADRMETMAKNSGKADTKHVNPAMVRGLAEFLAAFKQTQALDRDRRAARYEGLGQEFQTAAEQLAEFNRMIAAGENMPQGWQKEMQRLQTIAEANRKAQAALEKAAAEYAAQAKNNEVFYDEEIANQLNSIIEKMKGKTLQELSLKDLNDVYSGMKGIFDSIVNANKAFSLGRDKTITGSAERMAKDIRQVSFATPGMKSIAQQFMQWQMNPDVFFDFICGFIKDNEGKNIQAAFARGTERMLEVQREYYENFRELTESKDPEVRKEMQKLLNPKKQDYVSFGLKNLAGEEVKTSRGMMMQVYMMLKQKDSLESLIYSGFRLPNSEVYYKGKVDAAYGNMDDLAMISQGLGEDYKDLVQQRKEIHEAMEAAGDSLTQEQKDEYFQQLQDLRDRAEPIIAARATELAEMADRIAGMMTATEKRMIQLADQWYAKSGRMMRDVYMQMYGFEPKLNENYVPIHRDPQSLMIDIRDPSQAQKAMNLENSGFTKERVRSYKPILLTDFFAELESQKYKMSRYVGFAMVQRDFMKIWKVDVGGHKNINQMVAARFGQGRTTFGVSGEDYINHYIADVAGGHSEQGIFNTIYGNYAAATLRFNPRVAVSQAASIPTMAAVVGWKHMAAGFSRGLGNSFSNDYRNDLAAKNAYFFQRYRGLGGSTEAADIAAKGGMINQIANSTVGKKLFNWCQGVDVWATGSIMWEAAASYVEETGLKPGMEGYEKAVNAKYTEILRRSQPNYTTTERSDLLRDQRAGMKLLTMFKTQSNQNLNILMAANGEYIRMKQDLKNGRNGVTQADVKAAGVKVANAWTSVVLGGSAFFVLLRTMMNFIMGTVNPYRDKETDEVTAAGTVAGMSKEMISSMMGTVAFGGQIYDVLNSVISGDNYYGISDSAITALSDAVTNTGKVLQNLFDSEKEVTKEQIWKALKSSGMAAGIPMDNGKKVLDMIGMYISDMQAGEFFRYERDNTTNGQYRARLVRHCLDGDEQGAADVQAILWSRGTKETDEENQKAERTQMKTFLKKAYIVADITDLEAERIMKFCDIEDPQSVIDKWDFELEWPDEDNVSDKLVSIYNQRGTIDGRTLIDAYRYASKVEGDKDKDGKTISGSAKQKVVEYIQKLKGLNAAQKKQLWNLVKGSWTDKDTPWA